MCKKKSTSDADSIYSVEKEKHEAWQNQLCSGTKIQSKTTCFPPTWPSDYSIWKKAAIASIGALKWLVSQCFLQYTV